MNELKIQGTVNRDPYYTEGRVWKVTVYVENDRGYKNYFDVISFSDADKYNALDVKEGDVVKAVGECSLNKYNDYASVQLVIDKFAKVEIKTEPVADVIAASTDF